MKKKVIPIRGMHCRSCELLIEDQLKNVPGVKRVEVSLRRKEAEISFEGKVNMSRVQQAVAEAGYEIGEEEKLPWLTADKRSYDEVVLAAGVLVIVFLLLKMTGILDANLNFAGSPTSLLVVLAVGLTAGVSTCMALVGGLVLSISARHAEQHPESTPVQKFRPHLFFNAGRIGGYFVLGGLVGWAGQVFQLSGSLLGVLIIIVGLLMLLLGVQLTQLSPRLSAWSFSIPSGIAKALGVKKRHEREYSHRNAATTGALTFFLPCGFTQAMQLYAMSTGSFWSGALIMSMFAVGTAPGLLGIGGLTSVLKGVMAMRFFKFAGLVVIALAVFNISNGMNLAGIATALSAATKGNGQLAQAQPTVDAGKAGGEVQIVRMTQAGGGYSPNSFTVKAGIPVKWVVNSTGGGCASSLVAQKIGVRRNLQPGENIIEFTPKEKGRISFSCAMGMYSGWFNVI